MDDDGGLSINMVSSGGTRASKAKKRPRVMPKSAKMRLKRLERDPRSKSKHAAKGTSSTNFPEGGSGSSSSGAAAGEATESRPSASSQPSVPVSSKPSVPTSSNPPAPKAASLAPKPQVTTAVPKAKVAPSKPPSTLATTPRSAPVKAAVPTATASAAKSASEALGGKEKGKERVEKRQGRKLEKPLMHTTLFDPSTESDAASAPAKTVKVISAVSSSSKRKRKDSETVFSLGIPSELPIDERLAKHLEVNMGIAKLTEVQKQAIPILLKRKDLQVNSATGTGKTLAYAIPLVQDLQQISPKIKRADGPYAVILLPTRELVVQSLEVFAKLLRPYIWIVPGAVMGGEKKSSEKARLRKGVNVLIATPGRLLDHVQNTCVLELGRVRWLVLDEADRLLEKGFEDTLRMTIERIDRARRSNDRNTGRCNVLLSATIGDDVEALAALSLRQPQTINVSQDAAAVAAAIAAAAADAAGPLALTEGDGAAMELATVGAPAAGDGAAVEQQYAVSARLRQFHVTMPAKLRLVCVLAFLRWKCESDPDGKAVVFFASRDMVSFVQRLLIALGGKVQQAPEGAEAEGAADGDALDADGDEEQPLFVDLPLYFLHGGMSQKNRTEVFQKYCNEKRGVLFCTDVASRGLHLPRVKWIIQATAPTVVQEYVHRVGRTARLDTEGSALIMLLPSETAYLDELKQHGITELTEVPVADILGSLIGLKPGSKLNVQAKDAANALQLRCERAVAESESLRQAASSAYRSFVRAYTTYPTHLKRVFHVKNLHYGHVAKSFALREAPTDVGHTGKPASKAAVARAHKADAGRKRKEEEKQRRKDNRVHQNEFAGTQSLSGPKPKKRKKGK